MTFRDRFLLGKAEFDEIFDITDEWSASDDVRPLREVLGLTANEEDVWVSESDEALEALLEAERDCRILFTDLDGTLLNDEKVISPAIYDYLHQMLKRGHKVVISTGRALPSAQYQAKALGLDGPGCYIICYNGAQVYDLGEKKLLFSASLPFPLVRTCMDEAKEADVFIQTYTDTEVIAETPHPDLELYCRIQHLSFRVVDDVLSALDHEPPKLLCIDTADADKISRFREVMTARHSDELHIFNSNPHYLELVPPNVDKGAAVRFLCNYLALPIEHSLAAGDAENDIAMLKAAGRSVAMCNGEQAVKDCADVVTEEDNNHDGLLKELKKFFR